ncbi:hypothetical protein [Acaryochloris marina]|uniref:Uncharacterized protein n=1 Tax=Acaryochloris marina (strain MBIC 11017) TaxID=329726 RepID=A8ZNG6_ACAM1|nr:hypothetical protein [Acaryochloris marina]ABW32553.1 hypothetical protein AM1_D0058 [Acaryochloris marina MBIC11017]
MKLEPKSLAYLIDIKQNAIESKDQGEVVRATVADPWDIEPDQVVDQALDKLEPLESEAIEVDAVVVEPEQLPSQAQSNERPLVNEFIEKAGENIKQGANDFVAQANAFLAENIQVEYQPIPQQDGTVALAVDTPSLLTQMQLAGGEYAQAAKEKMQSLAPQQYERVSEAVKNTQERVKSALESVSDTVQGRLKEPSLGQRIGELEHSVGLRLDSMGLGIEDLFQKVFDIELDKHGTEFALTREIGEFKVEIEALRSQVGGLEGQISAMQQQQVKSQEMIAALQSPKPQLNNPRLSQWQSNFVSTMKDRFQAVKQYIGEKINQVKAKVSDLVESFKHKMVERFQPIADRLRPVYEQAQDLKQKTGEQINQVKATVGEKVDHAKQFVGEKAMDWQAQALAATATYVLAQQGKQTPQGTTIYEGQHFDFHRNQGNSLLIVDKATQQPVYKNGEFNQNAPKDVKDKLVKAAQTTQKGIEQKQAHKQAKEQAQTQKPKPKVAAAARR